MDTETFDFKFKAGDILTAKPGKTVKVLSSLLSWVSMGNLEDFIIDEINDENTCLVLDIWDDIGLAPAAYECMLNGNIGYIFVVKSNHDSNEKMLVKVG